MFNVSLNFGLVGVLVLVVAVDLIMRRIAFDNTDLVTVDIVLFSCLYSAVKLLELESASKESHDWAIKFFAGLVILLVLVFLHRKMHILKDRKIDSVFDSLLNCLQNELDES